MKTTTRRPVAAFTANRPAFDAISTAYGAAFAMNLDPRLSGAPCRAAFKAAREGLMTLLGAELGDRVHELTVDCGEYDTDGMMERAAEILADAIGGYFVDLGWAARDAADELAAARASADANMFAVMTAAHRMF